MTLHKNFIAGEWVEGKSARDNVNPSDVSDIVGHYAQADAAQTETAIAAAKAAFPAWSQSTPQQRADALEAVGVELLARKDEVGRMLSREEGKPLANATVIATHPGRAESITIKTDSSGRFSMKLPTGGMWLLSCVHMVPAPATNPTGEQADWESLWASLTFEVPVKAEAPASK